MSNLHTTMTEVQIAGQDANQLLSAGDLRDALQAREVAAIYKYGNASQSRGGEVKEVHTMDGDFLSGTRPVGQCVITSSVIDRDEDIVFSNGMIITEGYKNSPVVLPMHLYREFPIGFTKRLTQYEKHVAAVWEFLTDQPATMAADYYQLWKNHVLNAVSVGFVPKDWNWSEDRWGIDFVTWELLEHSIVTIPANPDAERSIGAKQYVKLIGEKLLEKSPIVRRSLEIALANGSTISVKLPESMKTASEPEVNADVVEEVEAEPVVEDVDKATPEPVAEAGEAGEASEDSGKEKTTIPSDVLSGILSAYETSATDKAETVDALKGLIKVVEEERDFYKEKLAELSISIIEGNTEVG